MLRKGMWIVTAGAVVAASAVAFAAAGNLDTGFGVGGIVRKLGSGSLTFSYTTAVQPDGRILVGGTDQYDLRVRRFLAGGADDTSFGTGGSVSLFGFNGSGGSKPCCYDLAVDGSGRIVCAGAGATQAGTVVSPKATVVRLLSDGSLDTSFGTGGAVHVGDVLAAAAGTGARTARALSFVGVALAPDGKIVVSGRAYLEVGKKSSPTFEYAILLARLLSNGALDTSFGVAGLVVHDRAPGDDLTGVDAVGVQSDGKVVVGVTKLGITQADLTAGRGWVLTRYLSTGAVDTAFGSVLGINRALVGLTVDGNDRILASGKEVYGLAPTVTDAVVVRYLAGGTLDATFGSGGSCFYGATTSDAALSTPSLMVDGRMVFSILSYPTTASIGVPHVVRLTAGGALDATFGLGGVSDGIEIADLSNVARSVAIAPNGDVVAAGRLVFDNGAAINTFEWMVARFLGN